MSKYKLDVAMISSQQHYGGLVDLDIGSHSTLHQHVKLEVGREEPTTQSS